MLRQTLIHCGKLSMSRSLVAIFVVSIAGCMGSVAGLGDKASPAGKKLADSIHGKWEMLEGEQAGAIMDFRSDSTTWITINGRTVQTGKYRFEGDTMVFESTLFKAPSIRYEIKIDGDQLTQIDAQNNKTFKLKRAK